MKAALMLREARQRAGLSQKSLAASAGLQQPSVSRIESGKVIPRFDTLTNLLRICEIEVVPLRRLGIGIDRSQMRRALRMTPGERLQQAVSEARNLDRILR